MTKSIRHLRGSESQWKSYDVVIPDGELAIIKTSGGASKTKIGNGTDTFSSLPYVGGDCIKLSSSVASKGFTLQNNTVYHVPNVKKLPLSLPKDYDLDYCSMICFDTRRSDCDFTLADVYFTGDDTVDGEFVPIEGKRYTVFIWYDSTFQAVVRGVPYA